MKHRELGKSGIRVSELGMGTIQTARLEWKESLRVVREVMDLGVDWFDTARGYPDLLPCIGIEQAAEMLEDNIRFYEEFAKAAP